MADAYTTGLSAVEPLSVANAAKMMGIGGRAPEPEQEQASAPQDAAPDEPESHDEPPADDGPALDDPPRGEEEDAAADDQPPGEEDAKTEDKDEPADDQPPIVPPRSWTKAEKAAFAALPREYQETILAREQTRERDVRKSQDEVAQARKALQAQWQATEQARVQYEQGVKQTAEQLASLVASEFADIKSYDDVAKLAKEDPYRHGLYQAAVQRAQAYQHEQARIAQENQQREAYARQQFLAAETAKFLEQAPEFADPKQATSLSGEIDAMLMDDYGIGRDELNAMWNGQPVSPLDSRFRLLVRDAYLYRKGKTALSKPKPNPTPKPASPPPQRSSTPPAKGEVVNSALEKANIRLTRSGSRADALAYMRAKRAAGA